ncbi:MAG TPA: DUF5060 domain-containing protein, partial [archaeon]|nr:DUF5060 domain-containing protein [archaeon]
MRLLIISLLIFIAAGCGKALKEVQKVARWGRFELLLHENDWQNPFTGVRLEAVFTSPGGREIRVYGFYDGDGQGGVSGDVFKVRFSPGELGRWSYHTSSNKPVLDGLSGEFECTGSDARGPLSYDPGEPWYLKWASGELFFESGANDPECFLAKRFISQEERFAGIDYLAGAGCNILYMGMVNAGPGDGTPEMKVTPWLGGFDKPDFDMICLDFMNRLEGVLDRMLELDMVAHLVFYLDDCCAVSDSITPEQEEMLFRYTVARFGSYPNLIWNLAEEFEECFDTLWCENRAALLKKLDPLHHPVTVHQLSADSFTFAGSPNFDLTAIQYNTTDPDSLNAAVIKVRGQVKSAGRPVPVSFIEWTPIGPSQAEQARKGIWSIALAGGTYQIFNKEDKGPMSADFARWAEHWRYAAILRGVMESLPLGRMAPDNSLVSRGFCLAGPANTYLVYQPEGGEFILELPAGDRSLSVSWIDPRTGEKKEAGKVQAGLNRFNTPTDE